MNREPLRPLVTPEWNDSIHEVEAIDGKEVRFEPTDRKERSRPLPGRPAGTECGGCSCS